MTLFFFRNLPKRKPTTPSPPRSSSGPGAGGRSLASPASPGATSACPSQGQPLPVTLAIPQGAAGVGAISSRAGGPPSLTTSRSPPSPSPRPVPALTPTTRTTPSSSRGSCTWRPRRGLRRPRPREGTPKRQREGARASRTRTRPTTRRAKTNRYYNKAQNISVYNWRARNNATSLSCTQLNSPL